MGHELIVTERVLELCCMSVWQRNIAAAAD